ncbi:MAG: sugar-binding domain-containing protein, partial [bacterium]
MIVDGKKIIALQLTAPQATEMRFANGQSTPIRPVRQTPCPDGRTLSLDGAWQVARWPFKKAETTLVSNQSSDTNWQTVMQPGKVLYADPEADGKPFPSNWNRITMEHLDDEDGAVIRRRVRIPAEWRGKRVILRFDAIYPAGRIYLNGELLGEHLSGLTPVEFDVTRKVAPGAEALVAVRLLRKHKFLKMDMVRHSLEFAGLAQSACLFTVEPVMVDDYHLITTLGKKFDKGTVEGTVVVRSHGGAAKAALSVELLDDQGTVVTKTEKSVTVPPAGRAEAAIKLAVATPRLWNDEVPNLYTVRITLRVPGQDDQTITYHTGFRRLDLSPSGPRLNGNFIKFRGVN